MIGWLVLGALLFLAWPFLEIVKSLFAKEKRAFTALQILAGLFFTYSKLGFWGRFFQWISRFSWELPQTVFGYVAVQFFNLTHPSVKVEHFAGRTLVSAQNPSGRRVGIGFGNFILGMNISARLSDTFFLHEFGHTLQSQKFGPLYLLVVGLPSLVSCSVLRWCGKIIARKNGRAVSRHNIQWFEIQANRMSARFFKKKYGIGWDERENLTRWP